MRWPDREEAMQLLRSYTTNQNLIKHALAVEEAMRAYAEKFGEDPEKWAVTGLLHDFDYEKHPSAREHPYEGVKILKERGYAPEMIQAILAHGDHTGAPRETLLAKTLYAVDELTGLIVAVALVRPSRKISDVTVSSVMKKWKDKAFAKGVNRENIEKGAKELGVDLKEHVGIVLEAMKKIADKLGL
ncbi:HDIG domain-containing protein [Candidatus Aerophobetes bacterium]|nr:HDIG domain-containing protein [Candidatus Aerophobetes bacterium]